MVVGDRKFHDFPSGSSSSSSDDHVRVVSDVVKSDLLSGNIRDSILSSSFRSPLRGPIPTLYCDWIASGRPLTFIEEFILEHVLPSYANTHSTSTSSSLQTSLFRHEARETFRNAVRASESDAVIFVGSGTTGALHKLISALDLNPNQPPVVISSIKEHHSNLLPWRELNSKMRLVNETACGCIDMAHLQQILEEESSDVDEDKMIIGAFSAASNITGKFQDDLSITALLHSYGALSFWDYATAAPYTNIDMNPKVPNDSDGLCYKDAVYFSVHKFVGGTQTPGVLIAKKSLFQKKVPECGGGGGSVFFVTEEDHVYLQDAEVREEGGTPPIVESIRAGLVMQLKQSVGNAYILRRERVIDKIVYSRMKKMSHLILLGDNQDQMRPKNTLPVYSFLIKSPMGTYLHHNFVTALLNDLFGIQSRGGCACAGPYAQTLLGISHELAKKYEELLLEDSRLDRDHLRRGQREYSCYEALRPGFTRLNFPWFFDDSTVEGILDAIEFVAEHGWKFLVQYILNNETGEWKHHSNLVFKERKWLGNISYASGKFKYQPGKAELSVLNTPVDPNCDAESILNNAIKAASRLQVPDQRLVFQEVEKLRWFTLPIEAKEYILGKTLSPMKPIFEPKSYSICCKDDCCSGSLDIGPNETYTLSQKYLSKSNKSWLPKKTLSDDKKSDKPLSKSEKTDDEMCIIPRDNKNLQPVAIDTTAKWHSPPKEIFKPFLEAMEHFSMIQNGDRVLVCLSGGKDSLSLLHTLRQYRFYAKETHGIEFELGAITVDPGSDAYDPRPLIPYLQELDVHYLYEKQDIMAAALSANPTSICSYCSRMKRGRIYAAALKEKYNVLAMGQHLDDLAESFIMSLFHNGRLRTMKANYLSKEKELRLIRPFVYVRESVLREFAETRKLPIIPENCPACFESPKERHRTKQLLAAQELLFPKLYWSLKTAMYPLMNIRCTGMESQLFGGPKNDNKEGEDDDDEDEGF